MRKKLKKEIKELLDAALADRPASIYFGMDPASAYPEEMNANQEEVEPEKPVNKRAQLLRDAEEIINGARAQTYGPPEISFNRIAAIWNGQGVRMLTTYENRPHREVNATDVALILIGMKLSRTMGATDHEDNWLDLAGYAGLGAELAQSD